MTANIGRNIAAERVRAGLSQRELGEALDKVPSTISRWERGLSEPSIADLRAIALRLEIPLSRLLPEVAA